MHARKMLFAQMIVLRRTIPGHGVRSADYRESLRDLETCLSVQAVATLATHADTLFSVTFDKM